MFYRSENHKNYYRYCYNTTNLKKIAKIIEQRNKRRRFPTRWPHYSPASLQRSNSLPDLSDSYPTTSSPPRSFSTSTLSSEANTLSDQYTKFVLKSNETQNTDGSLAKLSESDAGETNGGSILWKKCKSRKSITNPNYQLNKSVLINTKINKERVKNKANETKTKKSHTFCEEKSESKPVSITCPRTSPSAAQYSGLSIPHTRKQFVKEWILAHSAYAQRSTSGHAAYLNRTTEVSKKQDESLTTQSRNQELAYLPTERIHDLDHQHVTRNSIKDKGHRSLPKTPGLPNPFRDTTVTFYKTSNSHNKVILRLKQNNSDSNSNNTVGNKYTFQKYKSDLEYCCKENTQHENTQNKSPRQGLLQHVYDTIEDDSIYIKNYELPKSEIKPQQFQQCFEQQEQPFIAGNHVERDITKQQCSKRSRKTYPNIEYNLQSQPNKQSRQIEQSKIRLPKTEKPKAKFKGCTSILYTVRVQLHRLLKQIPQQKNQTTSSPSKTEELKTKSVVVQQKQQQCTNPEQREKFQKQLSYLTNKKNLKFECPSLGNSPSAKIPHLEHSSTPNSQSVNYYRKFRMENMGALEDHERKVIIEFCHLLEKSKQLFNGLRELPQYGHKQWHSYFGRTFDVYTKLWKFQQQHRAVLDSKYRLKRWQIGEIASKIGQLYYHFYLRTSETAYLNEAYSFYYAIRGRSYYTKASKEDKCELMVKKLRYYARFIVVCLLLKKIKLVRELIKELDRQIIEYGNTYDPDDQVEWTDVVDEVKAFIQAESVVSIIHPDSYSVILSHRLSLLTTIPIERTPQMNLSLQEVLIVGSTSQQVKFSELTMDMFRMLQTLEREPTGEIQHMYDDSPRQKFNLTPSALNNKGYNLESGAPHSDNPHKYLLFKPSPSQILVYLASGCNDLPPNGALLLYISADGQMVQPSKHPEDGYDIGGLITTSKNDLYRDGTKEKGSQAKNKDLQCFHPGDLYPFTRRPLFVIIDSENSYVFQNMPRHFGQPLVILMSPIEVPTAMHASTSDRRQQGSLFTLFLHSPLTAFCHCSDIHNISLVQWDRAQAFVDTFLAEASQIVTRHRIDPMFLNFMSDDFLRLLILRFIFCEVVLRMHRSFRARTHLTRSSPAIPDDLLEHPALTHIVMDLATHLQVRANFHDPSASGPPPVKE